MKKLLAAVILMTATAAFGQFNNSWKTPTRMERASVSGGTEFITGRLGRLGAGRADVAAKNFLEQKKNLLNAEGSETFEPIGEFADDLGQTHVRLQQHVNGLPVIGAEYIVHADADRNVFAMNGRFTAGPRSSARSVGRRLVGDSARGRAGRHRERLVSIAWPTPDVRRQRARQRVPGVARQSLVHERSTGKRSTSSIADAITGDLVLRDAADPARPQPQDLQRQQRHARSRARWC